MKRKSNIKRNIIIPIAIFLFFSIIFLFFYFIGRAFGYKIIVTNKGEYISYDEGKDNWNYISKNDFIKNYTDIDYSLQVGKDPKGIYKFKVIDGNLEMVNVTNDITTRYTIDNWFAYGGTSKVKTINYIDRNITINDEKIVNKILKKYNLQKEYNASYVKVYSINIDDDFGQETIYIVSNFVDYEKKKINSVSKKLFSFMFLLEDNKLHHMYSKVIDRKDVKDICLPTLEGILRFERDNSYKFLSYCEYLSDKTYKFNLYNYKKGKMKIIKIN